MCSGICTTEKTRFPTEKRRFFSFQVFVSIPASKRRDFNVDLSFHMPIKPSKPFEGPEPYCVNIAWRTIRTHI
jgi:hypothetical protein